MRNIEEIAWDLCELYYKEKPPIDSNGELQYYLAGSIGTLPLLCAETIEDLSVDDTGKVISIGEVHFIDDKIRHQFQSYRRKINDIDSVTVKSSYIKPIKGIESLSDIDDLSNKGKKVIHATDFREHNCSYNICRITYDGRQIIIPSPIDIISFKVSQSIRRLMAIKKWKNSEQNEKSERIINKNRLEFYKQIKDVISLFPGIVSLYNIETISKRMKEVLISEDALDYEAISIVKNEFSSFPDVVKVFDNLNSKEL